MATSQTISVCDSDVQWFGSTIPNIS